MLIQRVPTGFEGPGRTTFPAWEYVGFATWLAIWKLPLGLGVLFLPTATEYIFTTLPSSTRTILRAGMFTISRREGALSAAISPAAAIRIAKNLIVCIAFSPSSQERNADGWPTCK